MHFVDFVWWFAAITGIAAATIVSLRLSPRMTGLGFGIFVASSIAWVAAAFMEEIASLFVQNAVLFFINCIGVYRWLIRGETEPAGESEPHRQAGG